MQGAEVRPSPESRHCTKWDDLAFSPAWPNAPTFGIRKLLFAQFGLTDGSEPDADNSNPDAKQISSS
jgi:hypothetical protein